MKTTNDIKDQCTTLEQSKKLSDLGFTEESASLAHYIGLWCRTKDYFWKDMFKESEIVQPKVLKDNYNTPDLQGIVYSDLSYPCWTIADMMEIININRCIYSEVVDGKLVYVDYYHSNGDNYEFTNYSNLRDNLFDCLVWLKENKYL